MVRFFTESKQILEDTVILTGENAQHAKVLRLKNGEEVMVCDGQGTECLCRVQEAAGNQYVLEVLSRQESASEAAAKVSVYMAFSKGDKLEHVIQKATELVAEDRRLRRRAVRTGSNPGGFGAGVIQGGSGACSEGG